MARTKRRMISTAPVKERVFLVGVEWRGTKWPIEKSLDELGRLAETAGAEVVGRMVQRLQTPVPRTFIGSGKVEELIQLVRNLDVDTIVFDDEITPSQQSNLERLVGEPTKIIDRTALILDIFGLHAQTREGRLQVQLAQLQYLLPRLRGMWSHLAGEQTRGGIGSRFGQGESQLEVDRRMVRNRIATLKRELANLSLRREVQSKSRTASTAFRIALAGYTNAGKSTLLNMVTGASVLSEDKLFATLDPTTRAMVLPGGRTATLTDTVGFIQKIPHNLVEAFKSTLSEVRDADLILKVVDAADEDRDRHREAVDDVLHEIKADKIPSLTVFNKVDLLSPEERAVLARREPDAALFSARTGEGLERLLELITAEASATDKLVTLRVPYAEAALLHDIRTQGTVLQEAYEEDATHVVAKIPRHIERRVGRYIDRGDDY